MLFYVLRSTHSDETISFRATSLRVNHKLHMLDLSEWLKNATQHVFSNVKMKRSNIQAHRTIWSFVKRTHSRHVTSCKSVLLCLRRLNDDGHAA